MTLNLSKLFTYSLIKDMKISHFENCSILVTNSDDIPKNILNRITDKYGQNYLKDADILVFFRTLDGTSFTDEMVKKMFKFVDRSLGKGANNSSPNDFMALNSNARFIKLTLASDKSSKANDNNEDSKDEEGES